MSEQNPSINAFIDSVTEHAFRKHSPDLRDERSSGKSQPPSRSMGDSLQIVDKDNFRGHLRETLSNPETKYFIDESTGRMTFFNNDPSNRTMLIFNPAQFETDGHAGTLIRPAVRRQDLDFDNALAEATSNMDGKAPEIRSVADGAWIEHLDKYEVELANAPRRSLGAGDLVDDYTRARDFKAGLPYEPDVTNTKLNLPDAKGVLLGTGMVAVAGFGTLVMTGNPDLAISDDTQWMASTNGETNEAYTEASQLIERINDPYTDMHPVEYNQGHAYLTDPTTPDTAINLLESQYPDGMQKLRNEELEQLDQKAGEAVSELDRKEWIAQQNRMGDAYNSPAANDPNAPQTSQMVSGAR